MKKLSKIYIKIIGFLHSLFCIFNAVYGFVFPKNVFDYGFLTIVLGTYISWTLYDGHCPLSLYVEHSLDKKYAKSLDSVDIMLFLGEKYYIPLLIFFKFLFLLEFFSIYIVFIRNDISAYFLIPFVVYYGLSYLQNDVIDKLFFVFFASLLLYVLVQLFKTLRDQGKL
jgi:hypothetical protein